MSSEIDERQIRKILRRAGEASRETSEPAVIGLAGIAAEYAAAHYGLPPGSVGTISAMAGVVVSRIRTLFT